MRAFSNALDSGALASLLRLDLGWNHIGSLGMRYLSRYPGTILANCQELHLSGNGIGDLGMQAFSGTLVVGGVPTLAHCQKLYFDSNSISDTGMEAFSEALSSGALPAVTFLSLSYNQLGDDGVTAFLYACAGGALSQLVELRLAMNQISVVGMSAFCRLARPYTREANAHREASLVLPLSHLATIDLHSNHIEDSGTRVLSSALKNGALASIRWIDLDYNAVTEVGEAVIMALAKARGFHVELEPWLVT
jgi:Leucine-rich repeat (LRR) protein